MKPAPPLKAAPSLRRTLLLWLLWPLLLMAPAAGALQYVLTLKPALRAFDRSLGDSVIAVANFVRTGAEGVQFEMSAQTERSIRTAQSDAIFYVVLGPRGELLAGDPPLATPPRALAVDEWLFFDAELFDQAVRVGARGVACGPAEGVCQVRVAQTRTARDSLRQDMLAAIALSLLLLSAAVAATVLLATARGLRPLRDLSRQLGARSLSDLRPLQPAGVPREARPVVEAMNRLFERVHAGSAAQQAFLADAAHQLRTPLATLQSESEQALLQPHPPELSPTLQSLHGAATRTARLASQLLTLARNDVTARDALPLERVDLKDLAAQTVDEWLPRALAAGIDLGFDLHSAALQGQAFLLRELLANLLHNAIGYAGHGAVVTVRTHATDTHAVLEVEDNGPGIAPEDRERVLQRFQRGAQSVGDGSGLGLAIVNDIVQAHGGQLTLATADERNAAQPGLRVHVAFPLFTAAPAAVDAGPA